MLAPVVLCVLLSGCEKDCTLVGAPAGVSLHVEAPVAARADTAELTVCWDGACRTPQVVLTPGSAPVSSGCTGEACAASMRPTGDKHGFGDVAGLPKKPVEVRLRLRDAEGRAVVDTRLEVTPEAVYPNGRDCGEAGPQAKVIVEGDGRVHG
ncbi:hypothetical protein [Thermoactinospora rubra]|uniref:hypothetical protein n=1 Tax=Thermoactinospora rubra TaxID=1088767 RepID=UPI00117FCA23|nr:hypothetical protein [Thermoactinospora rubra]